MVSSKSTTSILQFRTGPMSGPEEILRVKVKVQNILAGDPTLPSPAP